MTKTMTVNGLDCLLMIARALQGEGSHGLPPGSAAQAHVVDEHPACPSNWMHGSDLASSYFLAVEPDTGMWLELNRCMYHTHHVAAVISIQGINPITGQQTDELRLEQYVKKCPVHDLEFQQERYCPECDFKWPKQNYLTTTTTPNGFFWLDGFRRPDGTVRQYVFTEEEIRGVAHQVIGDDKVYAIGIAFYLSKERKPQPRSSVQTGNLMPSSGQYLHKTSLHHMATKGSSGSSSDFGWRDRSACVYNAEVSVGSAGSAADINSLEVVDDLVTEMDSNSVEEVETTTKLEVGAGARINQRIHDDSESLDFWQEKPAGMIYINYTTEEHVQQILAAGKREDKKEGYMDGLKVGN